jgi:tetratricopeptide (TPR) repeat protein
LAFDSVLATKVALKLLYPIGGRPELLIREARIARGLTHPNIVRVHTLERTDGRDYLVMEYVEGESLAERLSREGRLEVRPALAIGVAVAKALMHAHQAGIVHRDVKPGNVLLGKDGSVKLADFGLARFSAAESSQHSVCGTTGYIAPEVLVGGAVTVQSDLYSFGIMLREMAIGEVESNDLFDAMVGGPVGLDALVQELLDPDAISRPRDAGTVVRRLLACEQAFSGAVAEDRELFEAALAYYSRGLELDNQSFESHAGRLRIAERLGNTDDILAFGEAAIGAFPQEHLGYEYRVKCFERRRQYKRVVDEATRAIDAGVQTGSIYLARGWAGYWVGDVDREADAKAAMALDPNNADALALLAESRYCLVGGEANALMLVNKAIALSETARYYRIRAAICERLRSDASEAAERQSLLRRAVADCSRAIELEPECADHLVARCHLFREASDYESAVADATAAIERAPTADNFGLRAFCHLYGGRLQSTIGDATYGLALNANDESLYHARARAHQALGEHQSAISDFTTALRLKDAPVLNGFLYRQRALSYDALGKSDLAEADRVAAEKDWADNIRPLDESTLARFEPDPDEEF